MEITDEIRRVVRAEECQRLGGHDIDAGPAFTWTGIERPVQNLADDQETLPHLLCRRCGRTWLVVPLEGADYDDAERALYGLLQGDTELARRIVRTRTRRQRRAAEKARGEGDPGEATPP